jgi:spermidine/putrescine transport system permease protein
MAGTTAGGAKRSRASPYLLSLPALAYLALFFVVPLISLLRMSLSSNSGSVYDPSLELTWEWSNYGDAFSAYGTQFTRSFVYAGVATILAILLGYPLAYVIAFRAGRYKNLLLGLVILPFFVTFLVRTLAWKTILSDDGWVVTTLDTIGVPLPDGRILSTSWGVVWGLTYNFLPFMILPIYVSLEKIDLSLVEAAKDLYSSAPRAFLKIVLPLSLPGVFAGSLLTFIPAAGDFINAQYLGSAQTTMIGSVIQRQFIVVKDYPAAAALSFVLMAMILAGVLLYAKVLGTEELT